MAHIQIKAGADVPGSGRVIVDGVDMSDHIIADGFAVNCPREPWGEWSVTMTIVAESLDMDLANAVLEVESVPDPRRLCDGEATA